MTDNPVACYAEIMEQILELTLRLTPDDAEDFLDLVDGGVKLMQCGLVPVTISESGVTWEDTQ